MDSERENGHAPPEKPESLPLIDTKHVVDVVAYRYRLMWQGEQDDHKQFLWEQATKSWRTWKPNKGWAWRSYLFGHLLAAERKRKRWLDKEKAIKEAPRREQQAPNMQQRMDLNAAFNRLSYRDARILTSVMLRSQVDAAKELGHSRGFICKQTKKIREKLCRFV